MSTTRYHHAVRVRGVTDNPSPAYDHLLWRLTRATRAISTARMSVVDFDDAARLLAELDLADEPVETFEPTDRRKHQQVLAAFTRFRRKFHHSAAPRVRAICERAALAHWRDCYPGRVPDSTVCLFTLSNFQSHWEPRLCDELKKLVPMYTRASASCHALLAAPVWVHDLFEHCWRRPNSTWRSVASDVPDGTPVLGPGRRAIPASDDEIETAAAIWIGDPLDALFAASDVLATSRLL